ncbi:hypothetical protein V6245_02390 [Salinibacterium amurskyense]|uniref:hypothetical protein n=1 Tax=Salinibacterium amurskyense TaxID=205941 RepID=UPI00311DC4F6
MSTLVIVLWYGLRTAIIGLAVALVWWVARGRTCQLPRGAVSTATIIAAAIALATMIYLLTAGIGFSIVQLPFADQIPYWVFERRISWPLVIGIIAIASLLFPFHAHTTRGQATLTRRTPFSFGRRWWFAGVTSIIGAIVTVTVLAGLASEPDFEGLWRAYTVDGANGSSFGTTIYGWYYSLPALALIAALIVAALIALWLIARPPIHTEHVRDVGMRELRTRNVLAITSGALLLHLGMILNSLASTAQLRGGISLGSSGAASWGTPFAAIHPGLVFAGLSCMALGFALWFGVLLSALPVRRAHSRATMVQS